MKRARALVQAGIVIAAAYVGAVAFGGLLRVFAWAAGL
jgi:hypothetical protein